MAFQNLRKCHLELINHMTEQGYSKSYIGSFRSVIKSILDNADEKSWSTYSDVYYWYVSIPLKDSYLKDKRSILCLLEQFDLYGRYPDPNDKRKISMFPLAAYHQLSHEFKGLIDFYQDVGPTCGLKDSTIKVKSSGTATFLHHQQTKGIERLEMVTEESTLSYFISEDGRVIRGNSPKKSVEAVFKVGIAWNESECTRILSYLPEIRQARKNIQYLSKQETDKIRIAINNFSNGLSLRDRAIVTVLIHTGLRRCDVANMTLDSIDWQNDAIYVTQQKTEVPLKIPLTAVVGNAIFDYIRSERPNTTDHHLFIRKNRPFTYLDASAIYEIVDGVLDAAGVRQEPGIRRGSHIFRHKATATMLENGIQQPVISQILGHASPSSLEPYLYADFVHLKDCALDISCFPINEGVFGNV